MTINISLQDVGDNLHPKITVLGVGGSGGNAVNNMINANLEGVDFLIANTDAIGCSLFDYRVFSDEIYEKQGKKQKKQGFKGFFSWLDQYI